MDTTKADVGLLPEKAAEKKAEKVDGRGKSPGSRKNQFRGNYSPPLETVGNVDGSGEGSAPAELISEAIQVEGDEPKQLLDMRMVMSRPAVPGETYQQKQLRAHLKANRRQFMAEVSRLEGQLLEARGRKTAEGAASDTGPGTADVG